MCNFKDESLMDLVYSGLKNEGIYSLITKLCEKFAVSHSSIFPNECEVKSLRSKCYDILLLKKDIQSGGVEGLDNNDEPLCHILAWEFLLRTRYEKVDYANKLKAIYQTIKALDINGDSFKSTLYFLINLRSPPKEEAEDDFLNMQLYPYLKHSKFLPDPLSFKPKYSSIDFFLKDSISKPKPIEDLIRKDSLCQYCDKVERNKNQQNIFSDDENSLNMSTTSLEDIWEIACNSELSDRRTWESTGIAEPEKEPPFATEANYEVGIWMQNIKTEYYDNLIAKESHNKPSTKRSISYVQFVKDVKYLLVGITSKTFQLSEDGVLYLVPNTTVEGLSSTAINAYCQHMLFCGTCYKSLTDLSATDSFNGYYKQEGYIFKEICESIKRYLNYYRVAVLSLPDTTNLLALREYIRNLQEQFKVVASVCKVGPFKQEDRIPLGLELLNYFYQKILTVVKKDLLMVLYAVFYPCCQLYFHRFLGQWILEGELNDPCAEFFIASNAKYISSRGRTYWTRSYLIKEDVVPDFLLELKDNILACGKAMNLLKLCVPNSPLCCYIMEKKPTLFTSCVTAEQLLTLEQDTYNYYLNAISKCGPQLSLEKLMERRKFEEDIFLGLVAKKRAVTLKRIEMERQQKLEMNLERKREEILYLKKQYDEAMEKKKLKQMERLEKEIQMKEAVSKMEMIEMKIFHEEAQNLIDYYNELYAAADKYRESIEKNTENMKKLLLDNTPTSTNFISTPTTSDSNTTNPITSSESFLSFSDDLPAKIESPSTGEIIKPEIFDSALDIRSNNNEKNEESKEDSSKTSKTDNESNPGILEAHRAAQINREKSRSSQYENLLKNEPTKDVGLPKFSFKFNWSDSLNNASTVLEKTRLENLAEAKKNKMKFFEREYGEKPSLEDMLNANTNDTRNDNNVSNENDSLTKLLHDNFEIAKRNKEKVLRSELGFYDYIPEKTSDPNANAKVMRSISNEDFINENIPKIQNREEIDLKLNLQTEERDSKVLKVTPMSVDTPSSDFSIISKRSFTSEDNIPTPTTSTNTEDDLKFETTSRYQPLFRINSKSSSVFDIAGNLEKNVLPNRILPNEARQVSANCLKLYLQQSVAIPLKMQMNLVNNELLKYFVCEMKYLEHLTSMRSYFFMLDGQFAKNLTDKLFEKLYEANFPDDLVNWRTLHVLVQNSFEGPSHVHVNSDRLSFRINNQPKNLQLSDSNVFDCISLTYKITWPLNILIPSDVLTKYDDVFKMLLKFRRVSWVLQKIFTDFKCLIKRTEAKRVPLLLMSPQYRRLHQCRHIMTQFVQTFQNYIYGEVLETSWQYFEEQLRHVTDLDGLYDLHTLYLKNILFMCLLNQKSLPLRKVIHKILSVILKFYDYLRSRQWTCNDGIFTHPNFAKLEELFNNFEEIVAYFFKVGMKVVQSEYQKDLLQLLESLNVNEYYTKGSNVQSLDIST